MNNRKSIKKTVKSEYNKFMHDYINKYSPVGYENEFGAQNFLEIGFCGLLKNTDLKTT